MKQLLSCLKGSGRWLRRVVARAAVGAAALVLRHPQQSDPAVEARLPPLRTAATADFFSPSQCSDRNFCPTVVGDVNSHACASSWSLQVLTFPATPQSPRATATVAVVLVVVVFIVFLTLN